MVLPLSQIKNLLVVTQSGTRLGIIVDMELETDSQSILRYVVQRGQILGRLHDPLLVHRSQVVSLSDEKMIVEDNVGQVKEGQKERNPLYEPTTANS